MKCGTEPAAGERKIRGERRALGAALFLDHLHQHDLPALDDFLDLVLPAGTVAAVGDFFERIGAADRLDDFLFLVAFCGLVVFFLVAVFAVFRRRFTVVGRRLDGFARAVGCRRRLVAFAGVGGDAGRLRVDGRSCGLSFDRRSRGGRFGRGERLGDRLGHGLAGSGRNRLRTGVDRRDVTGGGRH